MWEHIKEHKILYSVIATMVVAGIGVTTWALFFSTPAASQPKIAEATARLGSVSVAVENDGVVSINKTVLNFSQTGVLQTLNVKVGDVVKQGDALAALDGTKLSAQVDQAQATYNANISKASRLAPGGEEIVAKQLAVDAARTELTAEQAIYDDVVARYSVGSSQEIAEAAKLRKSEADVLAAQAQLSISQASYADAKYAVNSAYASVAIARATLYDMRISAPINGMVTSINGSVGQTVGGSQTSQNGFITVADPTSIVLINQFDEEDIAKISVGQAVRAEFGALNVTIEGIVMYVSPVAMIDQNGTATYEVRSSLALKDQKVLDGMSATVKFITKEVKDVVVIPNKAVTRVDGQSVVSYYDADKHIVTKLVTTGFTDGKSVAVTKGLGAGDAYLIIE